VTGEDEATHILESSLSLTQSMGLVVIYSCGWLDPEAKRRLSALVADRFFRFVRIAICLPRNLALCSSFSRSSSHSVP